MKIKIICPTMIILIIIVCSCNKEHNEPDEVKKLLDLRITALATYENDIWIGTSDSGVYRFNGESWVNYSNSNGLLNNWVTAIAISKSGVVWVGTSLGVSKYVNDGWVHYTENDGMYRNYVYTLSVDENEVLYVGNAWNRISIFDGTGFSVIHVYPEEPNNGHIHAIEHDLVGNMWVGSCSNGLSMFDGNQWTHLVYNRRSFIQSIFCCKEGDLWVADPYGAHRLQNGNWTTFDKTTGLVFNQAMCITQDHQNKIWIGTNGGLSCFDGTNWKSYTFENGGLALTDNKVSALTCDSKGKIWVGGWDGLMVITP